MNKSKHQGQTPEDHIAYFISDLHLSSGRPDLCAAFFELLPKISQDATDLFILGDFFDFWVGDDIQTPITQKISAELTKLASQGIKIYFQYGNRDFAVGKHYAKACHMTIIPDIYALPFAPHIIVLHGDQLCTADIKYQRYKKIIRNPLLLKTLLSLPKSFRYKIALRLREASKRSRNSSDKKNLALSAGQLYDNIVESTVDEVLENHSASIMIHGHTHKPNIHQHKNGERWVLSDWDKTADYLKWDAKNGLTRHVFTITPVE